MITDSPLAEGCMLLMNTTSNTRTAWRECLIKIGEYLRIGQVSV
jgi:hypothetical protein